MVTLQITQVPPNSTTLHRKSRKYHRIQQRYIANHASTTEIQQCYVGTQRTPSLPHRQKQPETTMFKYLETVRYKQTGLTPPIHEDRTFNLEKRQ